MDALAQQTTAGEGSMLARAAAFMCFAVAFGLMVGSLAAPQKAQGAGADHTGFAVRSAPGA